MKRYILIILLCIAAMANAQGLLSGKVVDKQNGDGVAYANISLLRANDSLLTRGTISEPDGSFSLKAPYGSYIVRVTFIGYEPYFSQTAVTLDKNNPKVKLGKIELKYSAKIIDDVEITAERSLVEYQLDKRVVNVDKNIVTSGGTAEDVLNTVPSVSVDNDGNVTLRGSSNVKVLIDGRSYEMLNSDLQTLLEQTPASQVESVEVITNPSAKYDPEGMSGIINIKLKEKASAALGLNGLVSANVGTPMPFLIPDGMPKVIPTATGNISLNYTTEKYSLNFSLDGGTRNRGSVSNSFIERYRNGATISSDSLYHEGIRNNYMGGMKIGGEYYFDDKSSLLFSYNLHGGYHGNTGTTWSTDLLSGHLMDNTQTDSNNHSHWNHSFNLSYIKKFDEKDRELTADLSYSMRRRPGDSHQEQIFDDATVNSQSYLLRENDISRHGNVVNAKVNYAHPLSERWKLETGYEGNMSWNDQNYNYFTTSYGTDGMLHRLKDEAASMHYRYQQQVHGVYATFGGKLTEQLSLQAGLRGEYSLVKGHDENHPESKDVDKPYWQIYPTVHASYNISEQQSVQLSYSRRVNRPRMWNMHPSISTDNDREMSFGNPNLDPEFTNAFELSYNLSFGKTNVFASAYYRQTNNMMTRYGFVWDITSAAHYAPWMTYSSEYDGFWASTWQNLDQGYNYGLEFIVDQQLFRWWKVNVSVNLFNNVIEGTELLNNESQDFFRASGKLSSFMTLPKGWSIQFSGDYRAPFMDLQTTMDAWFTCDLAVKKDVLNGRGSVNLRVQDVFMTGGWGHTTDNSQMYRVFESRFLSPRIMLGFSYKINNGLRQNKRDAHSDEEGGDDGGEY